MIEKFIQSENAIPVAGIIGIGLIVVATQIGNTTRTAMENGYDMSVKVNDRGEVNVSKSRKEEEEEETVNVIA